MTMPLGSPPDVVVGVPVTVPYERHSSRSAPWWFARAVRALLDGAGLRSADIDGLALASMTMGPDSAIGIVDHLGLRPRWLSEITVGGASGVVALRRAATAVAAGEAEIVACVAAETNRPGELTRLTEHFSRFSQDAVFPYGAGGANASFALITDAFLRDTGTTTADLGRLAVAQRRNAAPNPVALLRTPYTIEEYLAARPIADPLRLLDCVMPCAGAEAFLVMTGERAGSLGIAGARIRSSAETYDSAPDEPVPLHGGWRVFAPQLWERAGVSPADVDVVQTYDDYPVIAAMQLRDLGFAPPDGLADFLRSNTFTTDGTFPHNTSGGQLSTGQAGYAGGFLGVTETLRQLTGRPLGAPVPDAHLGLVSGFGMIDYDRGLAAAAALLERTSPR